MAPDPSALAAEDPAADKQAEEKVMKQLDDWQFDLSKVISSIGPGKEGTVAHADDAVDYEDIDELADDEGDVFATAGPTEAGESADAGEDDFFKNLGFGDDEPADADAEVPDGPPAVKSAASGAGQAKSDKFFELFSSNNVSGLPSDGKKDENLVTGPAGTDGTVRPTSGLFSLADTTEESDVSTNITEKTASASATQFSNDIHTAPHSTPHTATSVIEKMSQLHPQIPAPGAQPALSILRKLGVSQVDLKAQRRAERRLRARKQKELAVVREMFPEFRPGAVLQFSRLLATPEEPSATAAPLSHIIKPLVPLKATLEIEVNQKRVFRSVGLSQARSGLHDTRIVELSRLYPSEGDSTARRGSSEDSDSSVDVFRHEVMDGRLTYNDLVLAAADWDREVVIETVSEGSEAEAEGEAEAHSDSDSEAEAETEAKTESETAPPPAKTQRISPAAGPVMPRGSQRVFGYVEELDKQLEDALSGAADPPKLVLDMNDPQLLFARLKPRAGPSDGRRATAAEPASEKTLRDRFNISNDDAYELLKENYQSKVRTTVGNLSIDHAGPALRLQSPFYKVKLSKAQMRAFHRPTFRVRPGTVIHFSKLKQRKRKKDRGKPAAEVFARTQDLTLGDTAQVFCYEYSEEYPLALSNFGMGSKLINYYRKKSEDDASRPKLPVGESHVVGVEDRSPFWNFGFVEPGNIVPTLYNQMIRAPVFKHDVAPTDFLLVRSSGGPLGGQRYFLRQIHHLFTVGQVFPVVEIPGPNSRKVTAASKNRLKMIAYRVVNKSKHKRMATRDIGMHFPDQTEMQYRQRLKEFMEFHRTGEHQQYWTVKPGETLPDEAHIRSMISPEDLVLLETMQVGQQRLQDAGYGRTVEDAEQETEGGEASIEEELAPWNISRNFINATQGKAMLQLYGEGDPTGRGEAFSLLKISMKGGFKAMGQSIDERLDKSKLGGHSYNVAQQQKAYDEEIKRIWYNQKKSLSVVDTSNLQWEEMEQEREQIQNDAESLFEDEEADETASAVSHGTSSTAAGRGPRRVLRITRLVRDENSVLHRKTEIVKDPKVVHAYIQKKEKMLAEELVPDALTVTNDENINKRNKKILAEKLAKLERNQERREKKASSLNLQSLEAQQPPVALSGKGIGKGKSKVRRCATCGAIGHIRTNKSCPLYNERYGGTGKDPNQKKRGKKGEESELGTPVTEIPLVGRMSLGTDLPF